MRLRDGVNPKILCTKHLLGEHNEFHKIFEPSVLKNKSMDGYSKVNAVSVMSIDRHRDIVKEMLRRGYNHKSPQKLNKVQWINYLYDYTIEHQHSRTNLKMLLQGYLKKNGKTVKERYKPACKKCQERYIKLLKGIL